MARRVAVDQAGSQEKHRQIPIHLMLDSVLQPAFQAVSTAGNPVLVHLAVLAKEKLPGFRKKQKVVVNCGGQSLGMRDEHRGSGLDQFQVGLGQADELRHLFHTPGPIDNTLH